MSEGSKRDDQIMAPLAFGSGFNLPSSVYNPIYEAVSILPDITARRLVSAVVAALTNRKGPSA